MSDDVTATHQTHDSLRLTIQHPARARAGDVVPIEFVITNVTDRAVDLYLAGRDVTIDVMVRAAAGSVVWHNLQGVAIPAILQLRTLAPNDSLTAREPWQSNAQLVEGRYSIAAELLAEYGQRLRFATSSIELTR